VGTSGYTRADGTRQKRALAFQGSVLARDGRTIVPEVFVVDIPDDITIPGPYGPLEGTETAPPRPPRGTSQRRLTMTADRKYPGIQGPRHWLRSSPDGSRIAYLAKDDAGVVQLWTVSPRGGDPTQVTRNAWPISSTFTWSSDGSSIAHTMDNSVWVTDIATGAGRRMTPRESDRRAPLPHAVVFSPDGSSIAYLRRVPDGSGNEYNQIFLVQL
jgi:Tol biopolymer transport system component